jgi:hypothetical protein
MRVCRDISPASTSSLIALMTVLRQSPHSFAILRIEGKHSPSAFAQQLKNIKTDLAALPRGFLNTSEAT